ncbi:MAG: hypothetical protein V3V78_02490 [Candidatus Woesearchaeota archaeon]
MKRKLISQGKGGHTIYLPKKWIDKKSLKPGDEINLDETDNLLIIGAPAKGKKDITITITEKNKEHIWFLLSVLYRRGFDTITIKGVDKESIKKIKQITKDLLLGFELTETVYDQVKLENISEPTAEKYETLLRRAFLIIKETQTLMIGDLEANELKNLEEITELKNQQDKFILFCRRALSKQKYEKSPLLEWEILSFLVHIEHEHHYLYKYMFENKVKSDDNILEMVKELKDYFILLYEAYFKKDKEKIHKIQSLKSKFQYGRCQELIEKSTGKKAVVHAYIRTIFRRIQVTTSPVLAELFEAT